MSVMKFKREQRLILPYTMKDSQASIFGIKTTQFFVKVLPVKHIIYLRGQNRRKLKRGQKKQRKSKRKKSSKGGSNDEDDDEEVEGNEDGNENTVDLDHP
jgi:hypothetical protein